MLLTRLASSASVRAASCAARSAASAARGGGEVAGHLGEAQQRPVIAAQRGEGDPGPEGGAVGAHAAPLARVLAPLGRLAQVLLRGAVLRAPVRVQEAQVGALRLVARPELDEPRALAPEGDHPLGIHEEDGVVAHVLGERGEGAVGDSRGGHAGVGVARRRGPPGALAAAPLAPPHGGLPLPCLRARCFPGGAALGDGWHLWLVPGCAGGCATAPAGAASPRIRNSGARPLLRAFPFAAALPAR